MEDVAGIEVRTVTEWLVANVEGAVAPFTFEAIAGGHSNLTYRVTGADGRRFVLRRPPLSHALSSAHDMNREHTIISALSASDVPVPPALGYCDDPAVNPSDFYVMSFVDGHVLRDVTASKQLLSTEGRATASSSLVDTLATIHDVDLDAVGLSDLGRHDGYIARQLKRWHGQVTQQRTRDLPAVDRVHDALAERIPEQQGTALVHGDYRLDNCMVDDTGQVVAVLDWEICTLGDPLADLGLLLVYWTGPDDEVSAWDAGSTRVPGFWNREQLVERYGQRSSRDLGQLDYYVAFAYWKLACIVEGVYARYVGGALGDRDPAELEPFARQVDGAAAAAEQRLEALP